jgi:hypothetical protein
VERTMPRHEDARVAQEAWRQPASLWRRRNAAVLAVIRRSAASSSGSSAGLVVLRDRPTQSLHQQSGLRAGACALR